jgi:S1-C subfamily serine protease
MLRRLGLGIALLVSLAAPLVAEDARKGQDLQDRLVKLAKDAEERTVIVYGAVGLGSGAVVDARGTVVTNAHVGLFARVALLQFQDGRKIKARRRGMDLERDLAIYEPIEKLEKPVPFFELASERPEVGTWLVAVGYPGGPRGDLRATFSLGKAIEGGGLKQAINGILRYDDAIRTDIAIFPGNSGGPLLDLDGKLHGINGALEFGTGAGFAVPADIVKDRLETLEGGAIRLPGGRVLKGNSFLARAIDRVIEPRIERMVERVKEGFDPNPKGHFTGEHVKQASDDLARHLRELPHARALADLLHGIETRGLAVSLDEKHLATRIDRTHLVAKASFLGEQKEWTFGTHEKARVVKVDEKNDLALLETGEADVKVPSDAKAPSVGTLCAAIGPDGILACGIVSVGAREIPEAVSERIASGGTAGQLAKLLKRLGQLSPSLEQALEPIVGQLEAQESINAGNEPRGYERVLSHDAPLAPSEAGAPLLDLEGRLVGVNVSNANYGTSYAVPIETVRKTFGLR